MKLGKGICSVAAAPCRLCCTYVMGRSCSKSGAKTASASQSDEQRHMGLREMQLGQEGLMTATEKGSHRSMLSQKSIGTIRGSGRWMYFLVLWLVGGLAAPLSGSLFTQNKCPERECARIPPLFELVRPSGPLASFLPTAAHYLTPFPLAQLPYYSLVEHYHSRRATPHTLSLSLGRSLPHSLARIRDSLLHQRTNLGHTLF